MTSPENPPRRQFLKSAFTVTTAGAALPLLGSPVAISQDDWRIVGPREGFTPHVGTVYSMLNMMTHFIMEPVKDLTIAQLDYLHDDSANSIGALLWHMAATETYFQLNTFDGVKWGSWSDEVRRDWEVPMNLGEPARKGIKGHDLEFYVDKLESTRRKTVEGFRKLDDEWLMQVDPAWGWNNYAKWFHVAEHFSNHNGQIKWIKSRLPQ